MAESSPQRNTECLPPCATIVKYFVFFIIVDFTHKRWNLVDQSSSAIKVLRGPNKKYYGLIYQFIHFFVRISQSTRAKCHNSKSQKNSGVYFKAQKVGRTNCRNLDDKMWRHRCLKHENVMYVVTK